MFDDHVLVITGGTGTFGNAVLRRFLSGGVRQVRIFSRDEKKQDDMRRQYADPRIRYYIGDVRYPDSLIHVMRGAHYVFHAAALKQVPSCEFHPTEAIRTNSLGTENVLAAAEAAEVQRVVVLSTDKAAYPVNAMGMSKALAEKIVFARARTLSTSSTMVCATRYGNVMGSRGSVIPLFMDQIIAGCPLTVTDPNMTRFMMSVDDAVDLVLHAFRNGQSGDLFVRKTPAASLAVLVSAMEHMVGRDLQKRVIGTRHGEKLYETLLTREEMARAEDLGDFYRVPVDSRELNYAAYVTQGTKKVTEGADYTSHNADQLSAVGLAERLQMLPEVTEVLERLHR
jgi:UDP-N-acetylglucosamine 4,6-dehydratase/5-epimerase